LQVSLEDFKTKILRPVLQAVDARGLAPQIRAIVYSADMPTAVDISAHTAKLTDESQKKYQTPVASITGATFFYRFILNDDPTYLVWYSNLYARNRFDRYFLNPFADEKGKQFDAARKSRAEDRPGEAAEIFRELFLQHPTLASTGILAAECFARAGNKENAIQMLAAALRAGWTSRKYLDENEWLSPLLSERIIAPEIPKARNYPTVVQYPVGFSSSKSWTASGDSVPHEAGGGLYMLAACLAVVHENGSTLEAAIRSLKRSAAADRTFPEGKIRFSKTSDVRTTTRFPGVADALLWLAMKRPQYPTEVFAQPLPTDRVPTIGLMLGAPSFDMTSQQPALVPGAIAENLTSLGAAFETNAQTKLTDLLDSGAAMSSGAVAEPYALQPKFPHPTMYGFYTEGVTAIEAFYLSVTSPYQLLIVGDPLAQPFARASGDLVTIEGSADSSENGQRSFRILRQTIPGLDSRKFLPTERVEVLINGKLVRELPPRTKYELITPKQINGSCQIRVVLITDHPLDTRIFVDQSLEFSDRSLNVKLSDEKSSNLTVELSMDDAQEIELLQYEQSLGVVKNATATFRLSRSDLGDGPLCLIPVVTLAGIPHRFAPIKIPSSE
jgi:hypothetical protein